MTTQKTPSEELDIVLTKLVTAIQKDEIIVGRPSPFDEAKAKITKLMVEARIDELEKLHDKFYKPGYVDSIITPRIQTLQGESK